MGCTLNIVICDNRGLTFIGYCNFEGDSEFVAIENARCIIIWGTSHHLAELTDGPTERTKLGKTCDFKVKRSQVIGYYEVANVAAWS